MRQLRQVQPAVGHCKRHALRGVRHADLRDFEVSTSTVKRTITDVAGWNQSADIRTHLMSEIHVRRGQKCVISSTRAQIVKKLSCTLDIHNITIVSTSVLVVLYGVYNTPLAPGRMNS